MKSFNSRAPYGIVLLCVAAFIGIASSFVQCQTMTGNGAQWIDADTVGFRTTAGKYYRARLSGIDAPELRQTYGKECKMKLMQAIQGKTVQMTILTKDVYKRYIVEMSTSTIPDLSLYMIQQGCAWEYSAPLAKKTAYQNAEATARANETGLWAESMPTPPWVFRSSGYDGTYDPCSP